MAHAALLSGLCLANSGLGMAHGVAAALGVLCRTPHGLACAVMLPAALRANREVRAEAMAELSGALLPTGGGRSREAAVDALIEAIEDLCREVGIPPRLSALGVGREQIPQLVQASRGSSMSGNPRELGDRELTDILEAML
jgi:alcohol dehydrogenase class IV